VLNLGYIKQALFAADGSSLLVRMGAGDSDAKDEARLIQLPSGESRVLWFLARNVEWLGPSRALITTPDNELVAATLDGNTVHITPASTCSHLATPDGLRVYFTSGGCNRGAGSLSVLDVAAGTVMQVAARGAGQPQRAWPPVVSKRQGDPTRVVDEEHAGALELSRRHLRPRVPRRP
jgi:hypothetical protein